MPKRAWGPAIQNLEEQFQLKRQVVLNTAAKTFNRRGYERTTLADIAGELNVAKPTLYYYFKSKDEILFEIQNTAITLFLDTWRETSEADRSHLERLRHFVSAYFKMITSDFGACLTTVSVQALKPVTHAQLAERSRRVDHIMRQILRDGAADGEFAPCDPKLTAALLFGAFNHMPAWRRAPNAAPMAELEQEVVQFACRAVAPRPASR
jgi:AcrR family transcriptional regulator